MMPDLQRLYNGQKEPPEAPLPLRAGALTMLYESGGLRYIKLGDVELIRRIYVAIRDQNWGTVPARLHNVILDVRTDSFEISFQSSHRQAAIDFSWHGSIAGTADGILTFHMDGQAHTTFKRNRIGFCVLHPMACAGLACRVEQVDGQIVTGQFPQTIMPHQPFKHIRALQHEYQPGQWVEVRMEGDTFEMEDQRNWIDASFKTYCTPLEKPLPVIIETGTDVRQSIRVQLQNTPAPLSTASIPAALTLTLQPAETAALPLIGLGAGTVSALSTRSAACLKALQLAHLRVDIQPDQPDWQTRLADVTRIAQAAQTALEIAVHLSDQAESELTALRQAVQTLHPIVARWLIFKQGEGTTRAEWVTLARRILGSAVPLVAGTNNFFTELNRNRPDITALDGVVYSINPQVHAFDDTSLIETLAAGQVTLTSARQFVGDKPLHVSPVTFKMRSNPNATAAETTVPADSLPRSVDPRQMSLFGADWTLGSIKYLTSGGAASLTYYEIAGYLGVMAGETGSPLPDQFWSIADGVYPMYHIFADLAAFAGGQLLNLTASDALRTEGFALQKAGQQRLLITNLTQQTQTVRLMNITGTFRLRTLDETTVQQAMGDPLAYRSQPCPKITAENHALELTLRPYAVVTLDRETL